MEFCPCMQDLSLKVGLEIHQQLEGQKLFCRCPTLLRDDKPEYTFRRQLRAVAGEQGQIDIAAEEEQLKHKTFVYEGYDDTICLVEADEEPPHQLNNAALYTALQFCKLVDATISPVIQVMRKTVVDGSNTSGFQRTALIARNGKLSTSAGEVRLATVCLEEDASKIVGESAGEKVYRLDRLGIPLIEVATEADITSPEQAQETAKKIGYLLRSLAGVKRGLGTIRQDVNVSIAGGTRIEIKGAQDLRQVALLVGYEAKRQKELLTIKEELKGVRLNAFSNTNSIHDLTPTFKNSTSKIIQKTIQAKGKILGLKLNGFSGYLKRELQPNHRLGTELAERAKVKAGVSGIFHSDELPNYGITEEEVAEVRKAVKCGNDDVFVLVAENEERAYQALKAVYERAQQALLGIPGEVRKANADGTTSYLRPLPGAARMYPETDVPLVHPNTMNILLPETIEQKMQRYQEKLGLSKDLAEYMAKSDQVELFEELVGKYPDTKPAFIAETLTSKLLDIKRQYNLDPDTLTDDNFRQLFQYLSQNKIHKDIVLDVLIDMIKGTFDIKRYASLGTEEIHAALREIIREHAGAPFSALMGIAMKRLQGKASGQFIASELKRMVEKGH